MIESRKDDYLDNLYTLHQDCHVHVKKSRVCRIFTKLLSNIRFKKERTICHPSHGCDQNLCQSSLLHRLTIFQHP